MEIKFFYGRALQQSALKAWKDNLKIAYWQKLSLRSSYEWLASEGDGVLN